MHRVAMLFFFLGFFLLGLGLGTGWAYQLTTVPAVFGAVFGLLGLLLLVAAFLVRPARRKS